MRPILATVLLLAFAHSATADDFTGKSVKVKEDGLKLGRKAGGGLIRDGEATSAKKTYNVKSDDDHFIELDGGFVFKFEVEVAEDKVDAKSWVGKVVVPKRHGVKSGKKSGEDIEFAGIQLSTVNPWVVHEDTGTMLKLGSEGEWSLKKDFVPLDEAPDYYSKKIEAEPKNAEWHYHLGCMHLLQAGGTVHWDRGGLDTSRWKKELDQALKSMKRAGELKPEYGHALAWVQMQRREYIEAIETLTGLVATKTISEDTVLNARGWAWKSLGNNDKARADYTRAIEIYPEGIAPYFNRGQLSKEQKHYEDAAADYSSVLRLAKGGGANLFGNRSPRSC